MDAFSQVDRIGMLLMHTRGSEPYCRGVQELGKLMQILAQKATTEDEYVGGTLVDLDSSRPAPGEWVPIVCDFVFAIAQCDSEIIWAWVDGVARRSLKSEPPNIDIVSAMAASPNTTCRRTCADVVVRALGNNERRAKLATRLQHITHALSNDDDASVRGIMRGLK